MPKWKPYSHKMQLSNMWIANGAQWWLLYCFHNWFTVDGVKQWSFQMIHWNATKVAFPKHWLLYWHLQTVGAGNRQVITISTSTVCFQFSLPDSTYRNVTFGRIVPLYSVRFSIVMAVYQFLVSCGSWNDTAWAVKLSPRSRHVNLSWSQAGKRAFTFCNSVSLQRWLMNDTVLWNFEIDFDGDIALTQSTDSHFF
jgi:hypothetical protein